MTVQNIKKLSKPSPTSTKKKKKEKLESDTGKVYMLSNHSKVICSNWSKDREYLFGELLDVPTRTTVMVPASYVLMELKQNGSNKNN